MINLYEIISPIQGFIIKLRYLTNIKNLKTPLYCHFHYVLPQQQVIFMMPFIQLEKKKKDGTLWFSSVTDLIQ